MWLKINNVSHGVGSYNSAKCCKRLSARQASECTNALFCSAVTSSFRSSQEVIAESRWTLSHLAFLGTEARLHCRSVLHVSTASQPGQAQSCPVPCALSQLPDGWVRP